MYVHLKSCMNCMIFVQLKLTHYVTSAYYRKHQFTCHAFVISHNWTDHQRTALIYLYGTNTSFQFCLCCKTLSFIASVIVIVVFYDDRQFF